MNDIIAKCQVYLGWDPRDISIAPLTGGLTNVLYTCMNTRNNQTVVCRIYGEADVCRNEEVLLSRILGDKGLSPRIHANWGSGRLEQFIPAKNLSLHEQWETGTMQKIAQKLSRLHQTDIPVNTQPAILPRVQALVKKCIDNGVDLAPYEPYVNMVTQFLTKTKAEIGFCHNDLHEGNILQNISDKSITLIDYEYAAYNYLSFDIANHFCEWMFDYDVNHDPYFTYIPSNWPSDKTIAMFLFFYYDSKHLDKVFIADQINEIKQFALVSHITWTLWALSMGVTDINFNYISFASARMDAFKRLLATTNQTPRSASNG